MIAHRFTKHRIDGLWLEGGHYEASGGGALVGWMAGQDLAGGRDGPARAIRVPAPCGQFELGWLG